MVQWLGPRVFTAKGPGSIPSPKEKQERETEKNTRVRHKGVAREGDFSEWRAEGLSGISLQTAGRRVIQTMGKSKCSGSEAEVCLATWSNNEETKGF